MQKLLTLILILNSAFCIHNSSAQSYQWAHGFGGPNNNAQGNSIATDAMGNVYVTGTFGDSIDFDPGPGTTILDPGFSDPPTFIAKYDSSGNYIWAKALYGSPGSSVAEKIVVNNTGIYLAGHFMLSIDFDPGPGTAILNSIGGWSGDEDIFIAHYDLNGNYLWAKSMGGIGEDKALDLGVDNSNNLYITGYFWNTADMDPGSGTVNLGCGSSNGAAFFGKYDSNGNLIWVHDLCDSSAATGGGGKIALDKNNNDIYISGYFSGTLDFDRGVGITTLTAVGQNNPFIAKYDTSGTFIWAGSLNAVSSIGISAIYIDSISNDILITSSFWGIADFDLSSSIFNVTPNNNYSVIYFAKYSSNGGLIWVKQTNSTGSLGLGKSIISDSNSNVYLTGYYSAITDFDPGAGTANITSNGGEDIFFAKYDSAGNYISVKGVGSSYVFEQPNAISLDATDNIYLTGYFTNTMDADPDTGVAILNPSTSQNIFIGKYSNTITGLIESDKDNNYSLVIFPNPTAEIITILNKDESIPVQTKIIITNSIGQIVFQAFPFVSHQSFTINVKFWPPGIYCLSSISNNKFVSAKFIKN